MVSIKTTIIQGTDALKPAADCLRSGGLVAFPTETVYGLGGNALLSESAKKIFAVKGRPADNPLIVHVADIAGAEAVGADLKPAFFRMAEAFWPGPLTMVVKRQPCIPLETTGGLETVGIRLPQNETARAFLRLCGCPVAAPSANLSGGVSPTLAKHVIDDMAGKIEYIIDGGNAVFGLESTVLSLTGEQPVVLRPGSVTLDMIRTVLPGAVLHPSLLGTAQQMVERPSSPGMKYRHYAPKAEVWLIAGSFEKLAAFLKEQDGEDSCMLLYDEQRERDYCHVCSLGSLGDLSQAAARVFALLREADERGYRRVFIPAVPEKGVGLALMNRLKKAAAGRYIKL